MALPPGFWLATNNHHQHHVQNHQKHEQNHPKHGRTTEDPPNPAVTPTKSTSRNHQNHEQQPSHQLFTRGGVLNFAHHTHPFWSNWLFRQVVKCLSCQSSSHEHSLIAAHCEVLPNPCVSAETLKACALIGLYLLAADYEMGSRGRQSPDLGDMWK